MENTPFKNQANKFFAAETVPTTVTMWRDHLATDDKTQPNVMRCQHRKARRDARSGFWYSILGKPFLSQDDARRWCAMLGLVATLLIGGCGPAGSVALDKRAVECCECMAALEFQGSPCIEEQPVEECAIDAKDGLKPGLERCATGGDHCSRSCGHYWVR